MIDLFQDRRIFLNSKKKNQIKNTLPQIKFSPNLPRKMNDDLLFVPDHSRVVYSYQPLSNILISKKITPPNPEQITLLISKKRQQPNTNIHNFKIRKQSVKRIVDREQEQREQQEQKRNTTSLSNRIKIKESETQQNSIDDLKLKGIIKADELTFAVVKGNNNQELIREILLDRKIWKEIKFGEGVPNLKWIFYKQKHNYKKMWSFTKKRIINHFQFNDQICTKDSLIKNLQIYCETKKLQIFNITPVTFVIDFDDEYCQYNLKQFISFFVKNDPRKNGSPRKNNNAYSLISKFQGYMAWQNSDIKKKVNILSRPINNATYYNPNSYLWLLKPTGLNRGRGIQLFDSLQQLEKHLLDFLISMNRKKIKDKQIKEKGKEKQKDKDKDKEAEEIDGQPMEASTTQVKISPSEKFKLNSCSFVIQKYVQKPLLIENRKFDIRVWALLTESMTLYFFKEGYIRTSAENFSTENINNYFIHLTNNAIQKYSQHYGQFQNANQLSFWALKDYLGQEPAETIWSKIKQITFMTFSSVKKKINANQRKHCFQIFGLDFFIDCELKVWLIEVNQNPCIQCSSPLLGKLIPRMINDAFRLTIDLIIDKKVEEKIYPVSNYSDTQNMWQNLGQLTPNGDYTPKK